MFSEVVLGSIATYLVAARKQERQEVAQVPAPSRAFSQYPNFIPPGSSPGSTIDQV